MISNKKTAAPLPCVRDLSAAFDQIPCKWMFDSSKLRFKDNESSIPIELP